MKSIALLLSGCVLACAGLSAHASELEQPVAAEQNHLQAASSQMRQGVSRDGDLPLEFKKPTGPKAHHLLNLSF